jgi:hypothetical protein
MKFYEIRATGKFPHTYEFFLIKENAEAYLEALYKGRSAADSPVDIIEHNTADEIFTELVVEAKIPKEVLLSAPDSNALMSANADDMSRLLSSEIIKYIKLEETVEPDSYKQRVSIHVKIP